jgi:hypothetical protein
MWQSKIIHLMVKRKMERGREQGPTVSFRACPQGPEELLLGPTSENSHHFPTVPWAEDQPFNTWTF